MKLLSFAAILSMGLLSGTAPQPVSAGQPNDLADADGLPVATPITGRFTVPPLPKDAVLSQPGYEADVQAIMQLRALYEFYHDANNGERVASLFTHDGIFEIPYNDGASHSSPTGGLVARGVQHMGTIRSPFSLIRQPGLLHH
jgi:hypothetical protein